MLSVSSAPHIRSRENTRDVMFDVIIALIPCIVAGLVFFGFRVVLLLAISVCSCLLFEWLSCFVFRMKTSIWDLSAIVSGIILTMLLPPTVPLWIPVMGSFFMIVIVKMCFGGIGQNFVNPAATGWAFLMICFPVIMTSFSAPFSHLSILGNNFLASPTPLSLAKADSGLDYLPSYLSLYFGSVSGAIGVTSGLAIIIGFLYLLWRKVISWETSLIYVAIVAVLTLAFGKDPLFHILSGSLLFGAVFLATDPTTTPLSKLGKCIFAAGLGLLTVCFRLFSSFPEGVCFSIILMNLLVPYIDKIKPRRFGGRT